MSCMCGDTRCWSCGPAQGNHKCEACGKWDDEGGCTTPEECAKIIQAIEDDIDRAEAEFEAYAEQFVDRIFPAETKDSE